jgi:hypothetical protein
MYGCSLLEKTDFNLVKALQTAQQSFVVTDPSLPDNPIVFASQVRPILQNRKT